MRSELRTEKRGNEKPQDRTARTREIRRFGERSRELCPQDFLGSEALRCFNRNQERRS